MDSNSPAGWLTTGFMERLCVLQTYHLLSPFYVMQTPSLHCLLGQGCEVSCTQYYLLSSITHVLLSLSLGLLLSLTCSPTSTHCLSLALHPIPAVSLPPLPPPLPFSLFMQQCRQLGDDSSSLIQPLTGGRERPSIHQHGSKPLHYKAIVTSKIVTAF